MQQLSNWLLEGKNLALAVSGLIGAVALMYIIYNSLSYYILKEKYHGIRFTTKNIAYITMFTAVSVSVTVVISLTIPITVFPPIRVAFEGVMVKITGFIFGPIVGIMVGLITELLVMIFVPSFIHPAYIICVISYGFISGIGASFLRAGRGKTWVSLSLINIFLVGFAAFMYYIISKYSQETVSIFMWEVPKQTYQYIFISIILVTLLSIWVVTLILIFQKKTKVLQILLPIILFATACEFLVTTLISAWGDGEFLGIRSTDGYTPMVISRLIQAPLKIVFNSIVLYFVYKAVSPLIKRDR